MTRKFNQVFLIVLIIGFSCSLRAEVEVKVNISGIKNNKGVIRASLFSEEEQDEFPEGQPLKRRAEEAKEEGVSVIFNIPEPGTYAISILHDENNNGKMDKSFIGIPEEPYGNSGKPARMKPEFESSAFVVEDKNLEMDIRIH